MNMTTINPSKFIFGLADPYSLYVSQTIDVALGLTLVRFLLHADVPMQFHSRRPSVTWTFSLKGNDPVLQWIPTCGSSTLCGHLPENLKHYN